MTDQQPQPPDSEPDDQDGNPYDVASVIPEKPKRNYRPSGRPNGRPDLIKGSDHHEEYLQLMRGGWASDALSRYAWHRYGEKICESAFRNYKKRHKIETVRAVMLKRDFDPDKTRALMAVRQELIELQCERVALEADLERGRGKLIVSTKHEIRLLSELLDAAKIDMQDLGLFPHRADNTPIPQTDVPENLPTVRSLEEVVATSPEGAAALARALHEAGNVLPFRSTLAKAVGAEDQTASNGHANGRRP